MIKKMSLKKIFQKLSMRVETHRRMKRRKRRITINSDDGRENNEN
jgi:hypothetical protein